MLNIKIVLTVLVILVAVIVVVAKVLPIHAEITHSPDIGVPSGDKGFYSGKIHNSPAKGY